MLTGSENVGVGNSSISGIDLVSTGTFIQSGGMNSCPTLNVGVGSRSTGTYTLGGAGTLSVDAENIEGEFVQTGGVNSFDDEDIGGFEAVYVQTGGVNMTSGQGGIVYIGTTGVNAATGSYTMTGGTLQIGDEGYTEVKPGGSFTVGGTGSASFGGLIVSTAGQVQINATTGTVVAVSVNNAGTVNVGGSGGDLTVDGSFTETGGVTQVDGLLTLSNSGQFNLNGGVLKGTGTVDGTVYNNGGTVAPGIRRGNCRSRAITSVNRAAGCSMYFLGAIRQGRSSANCW